MLPSRCIIFGSGASIIYGMYNGLFFYLPKEVVFSLNDNNKFIQSTVAMFGDWCAYRDRFEIFSKHPLTIGRHDMHIGRHIEGATPCPKHDGVILIQGSGKYHGNDGLIKGLYSMTLTGAFTLNLAIRLGFKNIYMLGMDCCSIENKTHWYQDIEGAGQFKDYEGNPTSGVGKNERGEYKTSFYNSNDTNINELWKPFEVEMDKVNIYNVSPLSRISIFPKIDYREFLKMLKENPISINQEEVQKEIRQFLQPFNKA